MGVVIRGEIEGEVQLSQELGLSAGRIKDFSSVFHQVDEELLKAIDLNFEERGALFTSGWQPRKPQYRRGERVDTWPLLEKTGRMRKAFTSNISATELIIGNTASYFKYHQSNRARTKLPRRLMLAIDAARQAFVIKAFQRHIVESTRGLQ
jgi:phage gpG-like protein